ncbi:hypothetical protein VSR82_21775 [Burkholderia sp. JPY481]
MKNIDESPVEEKLAERRARELAQTSIMYRGVKERAFAGGASPRQAIKAFCLYCMGDLRAEVRDCTSYACPLHAYRPYQTDPGPEEGGEE